MRLCLTSLSVIKRFLRTGIQNSPLGGRSGQYIFHRFFYSSAIRVTGATKKLFTGVFARFRRSQHHRFATFRTSLADRTDDAVYLLQVVRYNYLSGQTVFRALRSVDQAGSLPDESGR